MFGLDARIKKHCHPELVSGFISCFRLQRAAMFGLDARIALVIFGVLSIISGAVLYKTIEQVRVNSFINEFNELGKAHDAYILDTGQTLT